MSKREPVRRYAEQQYGSAGNLTARQLLHTRFSTSPLSWHRWVFDQLDIPPNAEILELGCGSGVLWLENRERIPSGWRITLSDFSEGMLDAARKNLGSDRFRYMVVDAQDIPFPDASLDTIIADHMLYHVPDLGRGLSEIRRVLRPGGRLYTATNGLAHMQELDELLGRVGLPTMESQRSSAMSSFDLENGAEALSAWFPQVELRRRDDGLSVTEVEPIVDYILSSSDTLHTEEQLADVRRIVGKEIARGGAYHISKCAGMFIARKETLS